MNSLKFIILKIQAYPQDLRYTESFANGINDDIVFISQQKIKSTLTFITLRLSVPNVSVYKVFNHVFYANQM